MKKSLLLCLLSALLMLLPLAGHASVTETWSPMYTVEPTCTEQGYTVYDNFLMPGVLENRDFVPALGHDWGAWETIDTVTCTRDGSRQRVCSRCGEYDVEEIFATGHTPEAVPGEPATCTLPGRTESTRCSVCGEVLSYSQDIPPLGHEWVEERVEPTCITEGYRTSYCSRCGEKGQYTPLSTTDHSWGDWIAVDATCTDGGYAYHTCTVCGETERSRETEPRGHSWDNGTVTAQPTCTQEGVRTFTCTRCGETSTEPIPTVNHQSQKVTDPWPTCTEPGQSIYLCAICGEKLTNPDYLPPLGHQWNDGEVTAQPTCSQEGARTFTCARCGETRTEPIPTVNHQSQKVTDPWPTCTEPGQSIYLCAICGAKLTNPDYLPPLGHEWDEGQVTKEPGELNPGEKTFTCLRCGETKTEEIPIEGTFNDIFKSISDVDFNLPFIYTSPDVSISDPEPDGTPLRIVTQPESCQVPPGGTANLMVTAAGGVPFSIFYDVPMYHYQWYFHPNQTEKDLLSGLVNLLLWLLGSNESVTSDDVADIPVGTLQTLYDAGPGTYYCVVTDDAGDSVTSDMARVKTELTIIEQPENINLYENPNPSVTLKATGGTWPLQYNWYLNVQSGKKWNADANAYEYDEINTYPVPRESNSEPLITRSDYTADIQEHVLTDEKYSLSLYCEVTDMDGDTVRSVTVYEDNYNPNLYFEQQPEGYPIRKDLTKSPKVSAYWRNGLAPYTWQVFFGDTLIYENTTMFSAIYEWFPGTEAGVYYMVVTDYRGNSVTSEDFHVAYGQLTIAKQPEGATLEDGKTHELEIVVEDGTKPYTYELYREDGTLIAYKKNASVVASLPVSEIGRYFIRVTDSEGYRADSYMVEIKRTPLQIVSQPQGMNNIKEGEQTHRLEVKIQGGKSPYTYELYEGDGGMWWDTSEFDHPDGTAEKSYAFTVEYPGDYSILIRDAEGQSVRSDVARVTAYQMLELVDYTKSASISSQSGSAKLSVEVKNGTKPYEYTWYEWVSDVTLDHSTYWWNGDYQVIENADKDSVTVHNAPGSYYCVITDAAGDSVGTGFIKVDYTGDKPLFVKHPEDSLMNYRKNGGYYSEVLTAHAISGSNRELTYWWEKKTDGGWKIISFSKDLFLSSTEEQDVCGIYRCGAREINGPNMAKISYSNEATVNVQMTCIRSDYEISNRKNPYTSSAQYRLADLHYEFQGGLMPYEIKYDLTYYTNAANKLVWNAQAGTWETAGDGNADEFHVAYDPHQNVESIEMEQGNLKIVITDVRWRITMEEFNSNEYSSGTASESDLAHDDVTGYFYVKATVTDALGQKAEGVVKVRQNRLYDGLEGYNDGTLQYEYYDD